MNLVEQFKKRQELDPVVWVEFEGGRFKIERLNGVVKSEAIKKARADSDKDTTEEALQELIFYHLFSYIRKQVVDWELEGLDYSKRTRDELFNSFNYSQIVLFSILYFTAEVESEIGSSDEEENAKKKQ